MGARANPSDPAISRMRGRRHSAHSYSTNLPRGYEPRTLIRTAFFSSCSSVLEIRCSLECPSKSRKNRYPASCPRRGNDSIHVRLILAFLNAVRASLRAPGVRDLEQQGGPVLAGRLRLLVADDGEAGDVVAVVLDLLGDDLQVVLHGRLLARDGGRPRFVAGELSGGRGAGHLDQPGARACCGPASHGTARVPAACCRSRRSRSAATARAGCGGRRAGLPRRSGAAGG